MVVSCRRSMLSLSHLLPGVIAALSSAACGGPDTTPVDPARAFVETPSGRRITLTAALSSPSGEAIVAHADALAVPDEPFVIAKFAGPVTPEARRALTQAGYREVSYLPYDALLLERPREAPPLAIAGMVAVGSYLAEDRVARDLTEEGILALGTKRSVVPVMIHVMPGHDRAEVRAKAAAQGGEVVGEGQAGRFGRLAVIFSIDKVASAARELAELPDVFLVERIHHVGYFNDKTAGTIQSGTQGHDAGQTPIWNAGIHGEGQIVGMADTGLDANSCYFNGDALPVTNTWADGTGYGTKSDPSHRKIVAYDFLYSCDQWPGAQKCENPDVLTDWDTYGHGTHVAGNIVGDSDNNPTTYANEDGMAPAAKIVVQDAGFLANACSDGPGFGCPVMKLDPLFEQARLQGARIHNNSWGDNEDVAPPAQCNYSERSQDVDRYVWEHRDFLIVYAAGNEGAQSVNFSVGSPSTNKNGLSIGSTRTSATATNDDNISSFSSRGWTSDGRIKPDIMVPGCNASAGNDKNVGGAPNCTTNSGCGTSYAAPIAVGAATLARQYFTDGFYPTGTKTPGNELTPSAALLKATLINSAVSMKGTNNGGSSISPIPSHEQGWGRVQLDQTLLFVGSPRKLLADDRQEGMAAGATAPVTYEIKAVDAGQPLKITLVWTDYPGVPDSPPAGGKVDDPSTWNAARLVNDLDLKVTGPGGTYLGNVFADGASAMGGSPDQRNNVEQVLLAAPAPGAYTITVQPKSIVYGPQDFALVVTGGWESAVVPPHIGDAGTDAGPDGGGARDAGSIPPTEGKDGCSCGIAVKESPRGGAFAWLGLVPLAMLRGRRRRVRGGIDRTLDS